MSPALEHMTFDDLSELYRVEMSGSSVSSVRRDLFRAMADLMTRLRSEYDRLYAADPDSVMCEGAEHRKKSAERLCKEIVRIRSDKILRMAFLGALGSKTAIDMLTEEEKAFYYKVMETSRSHLAEVDRLRGKRVTVATHIDEIPVRDLAPAEPVRRPGTSDPGPEEEPMPPDYGESVLPEDDFPDPPEETGLSEIPSAGQPALPGAENHGSAGDDAPAEKAKDGIPPESAAPESGETQAIPDDGFQDDFDDIPDPLDMGPEEEFPAGEPDAPAENADPMAPSLVVILEDLPEFSGPDRDYSLKRQDLVTLPKALADVLVETGKASPVSPSP